MVRAIAARTQGDDYQARFCWFEARRLFEPGCGEEAARGGGGGRGGAVEESSYGGTPRYDRLEWREPRLYFVAMIDDATSPAYRRFVAKDSTEENLRLLSGYPERLGHHFA
jgi:hypothetical protein